MAEPSLAPSSAAAAARGRAQNLACRSRNRVLRTAREKIVRLHRHYKRTAQAHSFT